MKCDQVNKISKTIMQISQFLSQLRTVKHVENIAWIYRRPSMTTRQSASLFAPLPQPDVVHTHIVGLFYVLYLLVFARCQMEPAILRYAYFLPMGLIVLHNLVVFAMVMRVLVQKRKSPSGTSGNWYIRHSNHTSLQCQKPVNKNRV